MKEVLSTIFYSHWYSYGITGETFRVFGGLWRQDPSINGIFVFAQFGTDGTVYLSSPHHWPRNHSGNNTYWLGNRGITNVESQYLNHSGIYCDCTHAFAATLIEQNYWGSPYVIMIYY